MRKRQIIVTAFLVLCIIVILLSDVRHHHWLVSFCLILMFIFYGREHYKLVIRGVGGELFLRRQKKSFRKWTLALAVGGTILFFIGVPIPKWSMVLFWLIVLYECFLFLLVKNLNPITLVLDGYQLKFRGVINSHRNISGMTKIDHNGSSGGLRFSFKDENDIQIKKTDYLDSDIFQLIEICKERTKEDLVLSENLIRLDLR
ncbi:hypothetical protein MMU07_16005 [Aquiflexum sp. LQ15W]|uniref:hypothetical protein n=1 Tax=Cognataquiflexum nitidum TaxID=2922272 RepID=UPI001F13C003|nr:hypothetical protein [Cognataquiflexum nitidum]MCH6201091.1 hypothetical protein [Cognataquiflexum nitidum]